MCIVQGKNTVIFDNMLKLFKPSNFIINLFGISANTPVIYSYWACQYALVSFFFA